MGMVCGGVREEHPRHGEQLVQRPGGEPAPGRQGQEARQVAAVAAAPSCVGPKGRGAS